MSECAKQPNGNTPNNQTEMRILVRYIPGGSMYSARY